MGWLSGYKYRKSHVIAQTVGAGTDYQIKINTNYATATNSIGRTAEYASAANCENLIRGEQFTNTDVGTVQHIKAYMDATVADHKAKAAIYNPADDSFLTNSATDELTITAGAAAWYTFPYSGTKPPVAAATGYIPVVWAESTSGTCNLYYEATGAGHLSSGPDVYDGWPDPASFDHSDVKYSIYMDVLTSDSDNTVGLNSHCQTDFADVRFTASDGTTQLDHWQQEYTASTQAIFWVEISDNLTNGDATIYIYYGKADASSASDGDATFLFFDDFLGSSLDTASKWDVEAGAGYGVSGGNLEIWRSAGTRTLIDAKVGFAQTENVRYHTRSKNADSTPSSANFCKLHEHGNVTNFEAAKMWFADAAPNLYARTSNEGPDTDTNYGAGFDPSSFGIGYLLWKSGQVKFYYEDTLIATHTTNVPDDAMVPAFWSQSAVDDEKMYVDWCFLAKWVDPEPVHGSWGSEEGHNAKNMMHYKKLRV